jgi:hypothetical protein
VAAAAAPGVVLRVADRIVRIGVRVAAGEDLGAGLRRGIDLPIGVAAAERERRKRQDDRDPHSHPLLRERRRQQVTSTRRSISVVGTVLLRTSRFLGLWQKSENTTISFIESEFMLYSAGLGSNPPAGRRARTKGGDVVETGGKIPRQEKTRIILSHLSH